MSQAIKSVETSNTKHTRPTISVERIMEAIEEGGYSGFCVKCGAEHEGCEPDARNYPCESGCGDFVFGAEELLISL